MPFLDELRKKRKNALIITAHPDDESLFIGGTIAEFRKWHWRILCVTDCDERYNRVRRDELLRVCRIYKRYGRKVEPFMLGVTMKGGRFSTTEIIIKIRRFLSQSGLPDIVFTHNADGEYGHRTHKIVHNAVKSIKFRKIYTFSYRKQSFPPVPWGDFEPEEVRLSRRSLSIKKRAISLYLKGSQRTNLSRLARLVNHAVNSATESFHKYY